MRDIAAAAAKKMDRYFVDERGGCIAVRDRNKTDADYQGLHSNTKGVVQYWQGRRVERKCALCGHPESATWEVSEAYRSAAAELCESLNHEENSLKLIKERVAAGLRAMGKKPAGFVFIKTNDWAWDEPAILGIPVFHAVDIICNHWSKHETECRFVPMGKEEGGISSIDRSRFAEAYNDYQLEPVPSCLHPYASRTYGNNCSKCNICGAEFS